MLPARSTWLARGAVLVGVCAALSSVAGCGSDPPLAPRIDLVTPSVTCDGTASARVLRVTGEGLSPRVLDALGDAALVLPRVSLRRRLDEAGTSVDDAPLTPLGVRFVAAGELELTVPAEVALPLGTYELVVTDDRGRVAASASALRVTLPPRAFFVDPAVVWSGAAFVLTAWLDADAGPPMAVAIQRTGQPGTRQVLTTSSDPGAPARFHIALPAGLAAGDYDVVVTTDGGCVGETVAPLRVLEEALFVVEDLEPDVGHAGTELAVAMGGLELRPTPRLFLRPVAGDGPARALVALDWQSPQRVEAVVPADIPAGRYDLVALSPDGKVGVLSEALTLVAAAPPRIDEVAPESLPTGEAASLRIRGDGFDAPTVRLRCRAGGTGKVMGFDAPVTLATAGEIVAQAPAMASPAVCVVRVINASSAIAQYSAVGYSGATPALRALPVLRDPRRAPGAAATRIAGHPVLYVVGGDAGTPASARDTVESCKHDLWGRASAFRRQRTRLTTPRTLHGVVRVGRFVYALGGQAGETLLASIERAPILDPAEAPRMAGFDLALGDGTGLAGGQWIYRVAARRGPDDPVDPGGETLASPPALVVVPGRAERIHLTLTWAAVPGATGYRIYRTPGPSDPSGEELFVTETSSAETSWVDTGLPADGEPPLKPGALGRWQLAGTLGSARAGATAFAAPDPGSPELTHVYVAGGRDAEGAARDDHERLTITSMASGGQSVSAAVPGGTIGGAREKLTSWVVTSAFAPALGANDTWIYLGGGETVAGAGVTTTVAGLVGAGGVIGFGQTVTGTPGPRTGGGAALVMRGALALLGGGASASGGAHSAELCAAAGGGCSGGPPELRSWASLGGNLLARARYLAATVRLGPFVFVVGGASNGEAATTSVEGGAW